MGLLSYFVVMGLIHCGKFANLDFWWRPAFGDRDFRIGLVIGVLSIVLVVSGSLNSPDLETSPSQIVHFPFRVNPYHCR